MADKKDIPFALLDILKRYTDEEHILSGKEILSLLENEYDLTLERRTLYANVEVLKKFGHKISTWQENGYGYYLEEHEFRKSEILLLCNAIHSSHFISAKESSQLIHKLLSSLSMHQRKEYTDRVYLPRRGKTSNTALMNSISIVSQAIRDRHPVAFTYLQYSERKELIPRREKPYVVEPRYIVFQDSRAYVIATSDHHEGFANYRLDRIADISIVQDEKVPTLPKDMDAYEYAKNMYYMFNDEQLSAVIRCQKRVLDHVIDIFGTDCIIHPSDRDHFDVHIRGSRQGIILFAQQYLDAAEILEPSSLRQEMKDLLSLALRSYRR